MNNYNYHEKWNCIQILNVKKFSLLYIKLIDLHCSFYKFIELRRMEVKQVFLVFLPSELNGLN